jgi:hypothetical protein
MSTNTGSIAEKVAKAIGLCAFAYFVVQFHYEVKAAKAELKQENACMAEAASGQRDVSDCFTMMKNNNRD